MSDNSDSREWTDVAERLSTLRIAEGASEETREIFEDFWNLFIRDVIPKNKEKDWDYLHVVFRLASGVIEVWPQKLEEGATEAHWARIYLLEIHRLFFEDLSEAESDKKIPKLELEYAKLLVEAGESVDLDTRSGVASDGLPIYFYSYEEKPEIWKSTIKN